MICGKTSDFIDHPLPKDFVSAHGASHHAWAPGPHHLNPALGHVTSTIRKETIGWCSVDYG